MLKKLLYIIGLAIDIKKLMAFLYYINILYLYIIFALDCRLKDIGCKVSQWLFLLVSVANKFIKIIYLTRNVL